MMRVRKDFLPGKDTYLFGLFILLFLAWIGLAFGMAGNNDYDVARREVLLRRIGHEILLQSGDSTSQVLPIKKLAENEYQISFEHAFTFQPDQLVNTTQRLLAKDPLAGDYVVNVLNCANSSVAYGYAISKNKKDDIVSCLGRTQPVGCYLINFTFKPTGLTTGKKEYFFGILLLLGLVGFFLFRPVPSQQLAPDHPQTGMFTLGALLFDAEARKLSIDDHTIELTKTETRVLHIFALSPNEVIARSQLQKEIWEDEGVIVGRSLDVFISKLRKKLEADPNIKISVIRGKGYKLEVGV
jgi:hypothetical protein